MKSTRWFVAAVVAASLATPAVLAQPPAQPGPEHEHLKKMVGTWDTTMKMMGKEEKGTATYKMDLGGLWLVSTFETQMEGMKFSGRGYDSYNAAKKKYVGVWLDSMSTAPMTMEGTYDAAKKTMTMVGESVGHDGKMTKHKMTTVMPDDNTMHFAMYMGEDAKEPAFTILYKRKK